MLAISKRRRRLIVKAGFGTARLGDIRNHALFIVRVINTGERAVTVSEVEWVAESHSLVLDVLRHSYGRDLPVQVQPDDEVRILFDADAAARALIGRELPPTRIRVYASGRKRPWELAISEETRLEAQDHIAGHNGR